MSLLAWTLSFLRPHRARVAVITALAVVEVGFGALAPWPLKTVVDNVLGGQPLPWPLAGLAQATNRILVLHEGRLIAQGTHDQLLTTSDLYARMCARLSVGRSLDEPESVDELLHAS